MPETGNGRTTRPATNQRSRRPSAATSDVSRKENACRRSELPNDVTLTDRHVTPDELFGAGSPEKPSPDESIVNEGGRKVSGRPQTRAQDVRSVHSLAADQTSPLTSVSKYHTPPQDSANTAVSALGDSGPPSNRGGGASSMDGRNTAGAGVGVNGFLPVRNVNPPRYEPRHSSLSNRSSFYHSGIVDENLMISNTKLDSTLLMMFAQDPYPHWGGGAPLAATPSIAGGQSDEISMAPVMWRVHPMDPVQKETLEREMTFIVDRVNPLDIVDGLSRLGVLTSMDINQLNRIQGQGGKAVTRLMVKTLQRRGQKAYPAFLQALQSRGYLDVCERVMESERALRHGMRMEKPLTDWDSYNRLSPPYHTSPAFRKKLSPLPTDYNQYPLYSTFPLNAFSSLYTSPLSEPATFAYPVSSSQMNGFTGRLSPLLQEPIKLSQTVQEPIKLNHIERQLDVLKDELKDLHQDMHDLKSALRQGHQDTRPDEGKHGATPVPEHHHKTPQRGDSPHHERIGGATPTGAVQGAAPGEPSEVTVMLSPEQVKAYKVIEAQQLNQHLRGLQDEVRALHDDVTALSTSRSVKAETSRSQPDSSRREQETQAHRLDRQLGDLYGQLRALRGDVSQLKSEKQKRVVIAEPGSSDGQTKTKPVDAAHQVRPVTTRQTNLPVKQQAPDDRRRSSPAHLSPDDTEGESATPRRSSEGDKLDTSIRGSRITTPSAILLPPADGATKSRRITSPHTVLPDQSLPWPDVTRVSISS